MSRVEESGGRGAGAGTLSPHRQATVATRPDHVRRHPASLDPAPWPLDPARERPRVPQLVTAGLVLVAAAEVLEGYRWLGVIPTSRLQPPALVFALLTAVLTVYLTRTPRPGRRLPALSVALAVALGLLAPTGVEMLVDRPWSAHLLGGYDLGMAGIVLAAALLTSGLLDDRWGRAPHR